MATLAATFKIMPISPEVNMDELVKRVSEIILKSGKILKTDIVPFAFGLKQLLIEMILKEGVANPEEMEKQITALSDVNSAEIMDIRKID